MYVCIYVYVYVCMHVCMYVFVYVCVSICESETPVRDRQEQCYVRAQRGMEKQTGGNRWPGFFFSMGKGRERKRKRKSRG